VVSVGVEFRGGWMAVLSSLVEVVVDAGCSLAQLVRATKGRAARQERKRFFTRSDIGEHGR
jgi:hypothetical protein